jgi:hypothetical protein
MKPEQGGRFTLVRQHVEGGAVEYSAELSTPAGAWHGICRLSIEAGHVDWTEWAASEDRLSGEPPEWLREAARAALRTAWRAHARHPAAAWPRRLARWRPEPH